MTTPLILIVLGALCRILPHYPNAVAIGAVSLFAGAKLPRRWAWIVPIGSMALADIWLDWGTTNATVFTVSRVTIYLTYVAICFIGQFARWLTEHKATIAVLPLSFACSCLFFVTTNFAEWAAGPLKLYPHTFAGLVECYASALPFFQNTVYADLAGVTVLFGLDAFARSLAARKPVAAPAELAEV